MEPTANSYFSPKLEVRAFSQKGGAGVFARECIAAGEVVMIWSGRETLQTLSVSA